MGLYRATSYDFKSWRCEELADFDIPFAIKEYVQNTVGQILKVLQVREWRDWSRTDLTSTNEENAEKRQELKERLMREDPCLFAGEQGKAVAGSRKCLPLYVLEATISSAAVRIERRRPHDLRAVIVLWAFHGSNGIEATALTVYNNYIDDETQLAHFVYDGTSTNRVDEWAVGRKGKGFILATSHLAAECLPLWEEGDRLVNIQGRSIRKLYSDLLGLGRKHIGVGFNVGSRFGRAIWSTGRHPVLKVRVEDLRALSVSQFRKENPTNKDVHDSEDESENESVERDGLLEDYQFWPKIIGTYKKRAQLRLALSKGEFKDPLDPGHETALVREDDVCVHVVGLPKDLTAQKAFSAVFGIFAQPKTWTVHVPGSSGFDFFRSDEATELFYLRDQLLPVTGVLKGLGVNYHGELDLSSDRTQFSNQGHLYESFRISLGKALDIAICTLPELAVLIMESFLIDDSPTYKITPQSSVDGPSYRAAFEAACRSRHRDLFEGQVEKTIYPHARRSERTSLITLVGHIPLSLPDWKMSVLEEAGAYEDIKDYSRKLLLQAPEVEGDLAGLECLNRCLRRLLPDLKADVSVRQYAYSSPRVVLNGSQFVVAHPAKNCNECQPDACLCWVGAILIEAILVYRRDLGADLKKIFRVYDQERGAPGPGKKYTKCPHVDFVNVNVSRDVDEILRILRTYEKSRVSKRVVNGEEVNDASHGRLEQKRRKSNNHDEPASETDQPLELS